MASLRKLEAWLASLRARLGQKPAAPSPETIARGHEESDVNYRAIAYVALAIVLSAILIHLVLLLLMGHFERQAQSQRGPMPPRQSPAETFPAPQLQVDPTQDLQRLRASEDALLGEYAWVDRGRGLIRIPITRAMELLASPSARPQP